MARYNKQKPEELRALPIAHKRSDMSPEEMRILLGTIFGRPLVEVAFLAEAEDGCLCLTGSNIPEIPRLLEAGLEVFEDVFRGAAGVQGSTGTSSGFTGNEDGDD